jgi:ankyrin repeat protein
VLCEYHEARVAAAEAEYESPRNRGAGSIDWGDVEYEHECLALARDLVTVTADRLAGRTSRNPPWTNRSLAKQLIAAAKKDDVARLRELISQGAPIDPPEGEDSALIVTITESRIEAARCLLEAGANLNHRGRSVGMGPLERACRSSDLAMIEFVIDSGASLATSSDLLRAAAHRSKRELVASILALLVKRGLDPNYERYGWTILMAVCLCGDLGTARHLLDRGADPNKGEKESPLSVAKEKGYDVLVDLLLERGAVK